MTNIAMENPRTKWWFLAGNIIYKWAIYTMAIKPRNWLAQRHQHSLPRASA